MAPGRRGLSGGEAKVKTMRILALVASLPALALADTGPIVPAPQLDVCNPPSIEGLATDPAPVPFAPGDHIDIAQLTVLRNYLPDEIWDHRDRFFFEGMALEIGPCFRDYSPPAFFSEATAKFAGKAKLTEEGGLEGHVAGLPFTNIDLEEPLAGQKWAWNAQSRYRAGGFRGKFRTSDLIGRVGIAEPFEGQIAQNQLAHRADRPADEYRIPDTGTLAWVANGRLFTPFDARETAWHQTRDLESAERLARTDELHVYLPNLRKVRRVPSIGVEGVFVPSFGVGVESSATAPVGHGVGADVGAAGEMGSGGVPDRIEPKRSGFEGIEIRPQRYEYKVAGVRDVLAPINANREAYPMDPERSFGPYGLSWASDRWELRRTIVLEGSLRNADEPGAKGRAARIRTWFDVQTLYPLYYVSYDAEGEAIDVGYYVGRWSEDRPDYPKWPDDEARPVRVVDPVGAGFANLQLKGSWRRESWDAVSIPANDREVAKSISIRSIQQRGR
jgi:hypothetical protein